MGSQRQGVREGIPNVNYEKEQETFMAMMSDVAEVVREAAVGAARAIERLGVRNGNKNEYGEDNRNDENNLGHPERPMTLATFLKVNPPKFKGTLVATDADNWFRGIERSLRAQHVPEGQHVEFAIYMLEGEAEYWWQGIQRLLQQNENNIPWDICRDEFYKKYFPGATRDAKEMELMQLRKGDMTVAEYARNFDDLCCFSKICQGDPADLEEWKCLKFEGGLCVDLMSSIVSLEVRNFAELVNKSKLVEECIKKLTVAKVSRQGFPPRCLSNHQTAGRRVHFKARGIRQCKNLQVGNITDRSMGKNGGLASLDHLTAMLVENLDILPRIVQRDLLEIQLALNNKDECLLSLLTMLCNRTPSFKVRTAVIPSNSLCTKPFLSHTLYLNSVRVALGGSGCEGYVLLAASSNDSELSLERIQMVKEFPDVFLDDIPEFLPQQEIKFNIDLVPGTGLIFIAPYRMSPLLAELKKL
ncbi:uncharacterized protein LOC130959952 [Arachis stenosperma]|uniref:uncharacterized protein LOC130959952 n=1 Tax=Arachis stenosperma TaxID=217475 RepID=UPI0025AB7DFF|nr:uncharacterized protein LOC130959952 [Arachis stenosperma]